MTRAERIAALQARLGHVFRDQALLMRALTHKSAGDGVRGFLHNERLEWLGDRVLGLLAAERLYGLHPRDEEGDLTRRFNGVVSGAACARAARSLGMDSLVATSRSLGGDARHNDSVLADAYEAVLGALYLEGGLTVCAVAFEAAWEAGQAGASRTKNPKSRLQEWAQKRGLPPPAYEVIARDGPDHAPRFVVRARIDRHCADAEGGSKQDAEQRAAEALLATEPFHHD